MIFRRALAAFVCRVAAWPVAAGSLGFDDARHLLNRTSFAANTPEILEFSQLTHTASAHFAMGGRVRGVFTAAGTDPFGWQWQSAVCR